MPANIRHESGDTYLLRISGTLLGSEFGRAQDAATIAIDAGVRPRLLVILDHFEGFERGAEWGDLSILFSHSNEIAKIAIVGEPNHEANALAFAGSGLRPAPVKFFPSGQEAQARAWLKD